MAGDDEIIDEIVEGGGGVVETVADDEAKLCRDWLGESEVYVLFAALAVGMTDVSVRFSLAPLTNFCIKTIQVIGGSV
jgi:hypothetical protein